MLLLLLVCPFPLTDDPFPEAAAPPCAEPASPLAALVRAPDEDAPTEMVEPMSPAFTSATAGVDINMATIVDNTAAITSVLTSGNIRRLPLSGWRASTRMVFDASPN